MIISIRHAIIEGMQAPRVDTVVADRRCHRRFIVVLYRRYCLLIHHRRHAECRIYEVGSDSMLAELPLSQPSSDILSLRDHPAMQGYRGLQRVTFWQRVGLMVPHNIGL